MKKHLLLFLLLITTFTLNSFAADITEDLTSNPGFATSNSSTSKNFTSKTTEVSYKYSNAYYSGSYLMFETGGSLAMTLPDGFKCSAIKFTTSSGTSTGGKGNLSAGSTEIITDFLFNATNTEFKLEIPEEYQNSGTFTLSNPSSNSKRYQLTKIVFEGDYEKNVTDGGDGTKESPYTVSQVVDGVSSTDKVWVVGYIVGTMVNNKLSTDISSAVNSNLVIAASPSETSSYVPVELPTNSSVRTALNLKDNQSNLGRQVKLYGNLEKYFSKNGLKSVSEYEFVDGSTDPSKTEVTLSFSETSCTADLKDGFTAPSLTVTPAAASSVVKYSSSNTSVATVDESTGAVTLEGAGETTITASISDDATYKDASAEYTLSVTNNNTGGNTGGGDNEYLSYTIEFKTADNNNGNTTFSKSSNPSDVLESGAEYVSEFTEATNAYTTGIGGARIGQNKNNGSLSFNLSDLGKVKPTKIVVLISGNDNATIGIATNLNSSGQSFSVTKFSGSYTEANLSFDDGLLESFTFTKSGNNIGYVKAITVYYEPIVTGPKEYTDLNGLELITLEYNDTRTLEIGSEHPNLRFTSNPTGVVNVDSNGKITAVTDGTRDQTTTVTAEWGEEDGKWIVPESFPTFTVNVKKIVKKDYDAPFKDKEYNFVLDEENASIETGENHPELSFAYDPADVVTIDNNGNVTLKAVGTTKVTATWDDKFYNEGEASFTIKVSPVPQDPELSFRYSTVYGKADVGFVGQAVYHLSPGTITYSSSNPEVVDVNPETGMYESGSPCHEGTTTITATIEACEGYKAGSASYDVIIEKNQDEVATKPATALFDFTTAETIKEINPQLSLTTGNGTNTYASGITFTKNDIDIVSTKGTADARIWCLNNNGVISYQYRVYNEGTITVDAGDYNITKILITRDNDGQLKQNGNVITPSYNVFTWENNSEIVNKITFDVNKNIFITTIEVIFEKTTTSSGKKHYALSFNDGDRIINNFVDEVITLPELQYEEGFDTSAKITYSIDDESDDKGDLGAEDGVNIDDSKELVTITGLKEGVYTVRASSEATDYQTASTAILRLNVFPRLSVQPETPDQATGGQLVDDPRNDNPELTIVHPEVNEETGEQTVTIAAPSLDELNDAYRFSTMAINRVEVKNGNRITIYSSEFEPTTVNALVDEPVVENKPLSELPSTFNFTEDGYVKYSIVYAGTEAFSTESTVNVVMMPTVSCKEVKEGEKVKSLELSASQNSKLQYKTFTMDPIFDPAPADEAPFPATSGQSDINVLSTAISEWVTTDEGTTLELVRPDDIDSGLLYAVKYRSIKDISSVVRDDEDGWLTTDYGLVGITADGTTTGVENVTVKDNDANEVYYNLQGVRVNNPIRGGVYIIYDGKTARKVLR